MRFSSYLIILFSFISYSQDQIDLAYYLNDLDSYNQSIPKPSDYLLNNKEVGSSHISHDRLVQYMYALAEASDRITIENRGRTFEGRPLILLTISSKKNQVFKKFFNKTKILSPFKLNINYKKYQKIFDVFSKKIKQGETYQIKVCTKYKNKSQINPINFFWKLMKINSSPEAFMIRDKDFSIVSCSPETLIDKKGNNIITKPIAGTLRKNKNINKFKALNFFKNNDKETKEHNMIVDMERSDLSRICKPGSVKILKQKYVEEYKHLFHYVTTIQGKLRNKIKIKNIIKSMMPGGSVIGCPKIRTLELLNKQETEDRNIFTGSFGYIKFNQDMRFNIIIRSILNFKNISEISAASGIVLESSPKKEFNENFIKAKSLLDLYK